jgi:glycoprotein endo-alpha-1,2-mannosidase
VTSVRRFALVLCLLLAGFPAAARAASVGIFYYPWYSVPSHDGSYAHWQQDGRAPPADIASNYYPARGPYSSGDPAVVNAQMREIAGAGVDEVISSWWGWGSVEDQRLPQVIASARANGLSVAVQIEPYVGRSVETVAADIEHLRGLGITRVYLYRPWQTAEDWSPLNASLTGVEVLAQTGNVAWAAAEHFAGVYTYDILRYGPSAFGGFCGRVRAAHLLCAPSVGPGYEANRATGDVRIEPRRNGATYDAMWSAAIAARPDEVTVTSYNEWHEGTQIEPAASRSGRRSAAVRGYLTYDGAWGMHGRTAQRAYLWRTAYWAKLFAFGHAPSRWRSAFAASP